MRGNSHVRCGAGENSAIISKSYLSLFTGDVRTWNDAKKSELGDREKHDTDNYQDWFSSSGRKMKDDEE